MGTVFTASLLTIAIRPQYFGVWFHSVFSTAMLTTYMRKFHPETYGELRTSISQMGFDLTPDHLQLSNISSVFPKTDLVPFGAGQVHASVGAGQVHASVVGFKDSTSSNIRQQAQT